MSNQLATNNGEPQLPALPQQMLPALSQITAALGIPRSVLAPDEEIQYAWRDLPRELAQIPSNLRDELIARMCVAVSTGLFDGAINYAWNATIIHLRQMIREFGLPVVAQTLQKDFEEKHLLDLQDNQLLELSLKLGLISEDGFFFLDQCRDTRNNFSAAHPTIGKINDREFTTFLNRCIRYSLAAEVFPRGVDVGSFISAVKGTRFNEDQLTVWTDRLQATHDAQRQLLLGTVHGLYCDPNATEPVRLNSLDLCRRCSPAFNAAIRSDLVDRHSDYVAKGDTQRHTASQQFFERLGLLSLLNESERHGVISRATTQLWNVHQAMNNFYNEPPFAERLRRISEQEPIPETIQEEFVRVVVGCRIGNGYGVSGAAEDHYNAMVQGFSPREVRLAVSLCRSNDIVGRRIQNSGSCRRNYSELLGLIEPASVPSDVRSDYEHYINNG
ncbi:hypothetical protein [Pelagicoccus sp. SDUM812005]|uniref:hypothetical protein n=1 Tax=Pelagicoccus sp. SDUM812005 TaxID=3041257 RepID=UPI0028109B61|nr:hypothetical protein [Pelagicoccus sp. SDUM812005]MDQ8183869.1 hypothetical protein [Pelagicoccus sp. SDUM812005]